MKGDFHMHTTFSDGALTVDEVLALAKEKGLDIISITDHDELEGSIFAKKIADKYDIKTIVGFEFSTTFKDESIHILAYFKSLDYIDQLLKLLKVQREKRLHRAYEIKNRLKKFFNIDLDMTNLFKINSITRGSIANEIIKQGNNYTKQEIFKKMIGDDCPAYIPSSKIDTSYGIKLIKDCGGIAVLAHPINLKKVTPEEVIAFGIDGIEAIYPANQENDTLRYKSLAKKYNLFITAGSDFHSMNDHKHGNIGDIWIEDGDLNNFLKKMELL